MHVWPPSTDIQGRSQTLYTAPCNGIISHGALQVFVDHTCKYKCVIDFRALWGVLCVFIFTHVDCSRCRWHTHLRNHSYFDYGKKPKTSNLSPSGISLVYLCLCHISLVVCWKYFVAITSLIFSILSLPRQINLAIYRISWPTFWRHGIKYMFIP